LVEPLWGNLLVCPSEAVDLLVEDEKVGIVAGSGFYLGESCSS
jgi:hypothetical protein